MLQLRQRYISRTREKIIKALSSSRKSVLPYADLYGEAMEFPLVTQNDLEDLLRAMIPNIQIHLDGSHRKKPSPFKDDRVEVINPKALK